jgi:hypothetical protein
MNTSITPPAGEAASANYDPAGEPTPIAALPDDPALEHELAASRRAALETGDVPPLDPLGLYALEVERDEALEDLAAHLPADASIRRPPPRDRRAVRRPRRRVEARQFISTALSSLEPRTAPASKLIFESRAAPRSKPCS